MLRHLSTGLISRASSNPFRNGDVGAGNSWFLNTVFDFYSESNTASPVFVKLSKSGVGNYEPLNFRE